MVTKELTLILKQPILFHILGVYLLLLLFLTVPVYAFSGNISLEQSLTEYIGSIYRDPFQPQIELDDPPVIEFPEPVRWPELLVQGVIWDSPIPVAIINNRVLREKEVFFVSNISDNQRVTVVSIDKNAVTVGYLGEFKALPTPAGNFRVR